MKLCFLALTDNALEAAEAYLKEVALAALLFCFVYVHATDLLAIKPERDFGNVIVELRAFAAGSIIEVDLYVNAFDHHVGVVCFKLEAEDFYVLFAFIKA